MSSTLPTTLTQQILSGISKFPPSISALMGYGIILAWSDDATSAITIAADTNAFSPVVPNAAWVTPVTPAVLVVPDRALVYLAWCDSAGNVFLGSSKDAFQQATQIGTIGSDGDGPALAYDSGTLYVAFRKASNQYLATVDVQNNVSVLGPFGTASSRQTVNAFGSDILIASGTAWDDETAGVLQIILSTDGGQSFQPVNVPPGIVTMGPPSIALLGDALYVCWCDRATGQIFIGTTSQMNDFSSISPATAYNYGCHNGGPALSSYLAITNQTTLVPELLVGWSVVAAGTDPTNHHISLGTITVDTAALTQDQAREQFLKRHPSNSRSFVVDPCPDRKTIYDPATEQCVLRFGCWGQCVLQAFIILWGLPPWFDPIKYSVCVIVCKNSGAQMNADAEGG